MSAVIAFILAVLTMLGVGAPDASSKQAPMPPCGGMVVTVDGDQDMTCDVVPGQRLDVTNVTFGECMDMGGIWLLSGTCQDVDF